MVTHAATVYDVHPGMAGCPTPIPEPLRLAATAIVGQRLPLTEVIERLRESVADGAFNIAEDFITYGSGRQIYIPCASPGLLAWENSWRVVRIER